MIFFLVAAPGQHCDVCDGIYATLCWPHGLLLHSIHTFLVSILATLFDKCMLLLCHQRNLPISPCTYILVMSVCLILSVHLSLLSLPSLLSLSPSPTRFINEYSHVLHLVYLLCLKSTEAGTCRF